MPIRFRTRNPGFLALALAATSAVSAAQHAPGVPESCSGDEPLPAVTRSIEGLQVAVDRATGRLVPPSAAQREKLRQALARMLDQSSEGLEPRHHPDGSVSVDLRGRFQNVTLAVVDAQGKPTLHCVDDPRGADAALDAGAQLEAPEPAAPEGGELR